jgi:deoxyxylulose-5-phosphate synthase
VGAVFEELGFTYMGPVDGHNLQELINTFKEAHKHVGPVLVHVATTKGKGYAIAEKDQVGYHAQSPFNFPPVRACHPTSPNPPAIPRYLLKPWSSWPKTTRKSSALQQPWLPVQVSTNYKKNCLSNTLMSVLPNNMPSPWLRA